MQKIWWVVGVVVIAGLGWWGYSQYQPEQVAEEKIKIGVAIGATGYAANWGEGELRAIQIALDEYQSKIGAPVELIVEDTNSDDVGTVNAITKLVNVDKVQAIIGPTWGDSFQGGLPIAENAHVVLLTPSSAIETITDKPQYSYLFSTWWPQDPEVEVLLADMKKSNFKRLAVLSDQDAFNTQIADRLAAAANAASAGYVVDRTSVPIATNDFRTYIAKIKSHKPDAVFVQFLDGSLMGILAKQMKEQGLTVQIYGTPDAENADNLAKFPGYYDGMKYAFPSYANDPSYRELLQKLKDKFGAEAVQSPSFVNAYNASIMLFEVLKAGARTGTEIRDELQKVHMSGVGSKDLYFDKNGQLGDVTFIMKAIQGNTFVELP